MTKTNIVEKGIGQLMLEGMFKRAMNKYFGNVKFDLILYSTPPITFNNVIKTAKKRNPNAVTYLLLKDIFPQNAVDLGMMTKRASMGCCIGCSARKRRHYINSLTISAV